MTRIPVSLQQPFTAADWPLCRRCETIARFWGLHWNAVRLVVLRGNGKRDLVAFKYSILRRHQRSHFLSGAAKLGINRSMPPAMIAGCYHHLSNAIGGLSMEYVEETPCKIWVRNLPRMELPGAKLVRRACLRRARHIRRLAPLQWPLARLPPAGLVVAKVYQQSEPCDEGYFVEHDRDCR